MKEYTSEQVADHFGRLCKMIAEPGVYGDVGQREADAMQWAIDRIQTLASRITVLEQQLERRIRDNAELVSMIIRKNGWPDGE